jgi:hypothetical protein
MSLVRLAILCVLACANLIAAQTGDLQTKGYICKQIRGGLYWITDGAYNKMFLVTREVPTWKKRLTDTSTYLKDNCWVMIEATIVQLPPFSEGNASPK